MDCELTELFGFASVGACEQVPKYVFNKLTYAIDIALLAWRLRLAKVASNQVVTKKPRAMQFRLYYG